MGILKKPKFLIIGGAVLLAAIALTAALLFLLQPDKIGFFGLDPEAAETVRLQALLEDEGYEVYYAESLEDLESAACKAWIIQTTSDIFAQKIGDIVGNKAIFIHRKPSLSQPVRYVGWNMEEAGAALSGLLPLLPAYGDTNEDGVLSCLLLTPPADDMETAQWEQGIRAGLENFPLPHTILDVCPCPRTEQAGFDAVTNRLSAYGRDIEVILAASEDLAEGAAKAIWQGGWAVNTDFYLLSIGSTEKSLRALQEQKRSALVFADQAAFDEAVLSAVSDTIDGKDPLDYFLPHTTYHTTAPLG